MADARERLDLSLVEAAHLAGEDGTLGDDRAEHPRHLDIDAIERFARGDAGVVDSRLGVAYDAIVFGVFQ